MKKQNKAGGRKMGFSKMLELLQEKNKGYIILANAGAFYLARGRDAVKLNREKICTKIRKKGLTNAKSMI